MSGSREHDAEHLRPPMHPTRSSANLSPTSSPGTFVSRPPVHPSHPSYLSPASLSTNLPPVPPPQPSPRLSPPLPPRSPGASPNISPLPTQPPPPSFNLGAFPSEIPPQRSTLPPRSTPSGSLVTSSPGLSPLVQHVPVEGQGSGGEFEALPAAAVPLGVCAGPYTDTLSSVGPKDEEELSEVQLRELYDDEEVERFLKVFSTVSSRMASGLLSEKRPETILVCSGGPNDAACRCRTLTCRGGCRATGSSW